MENPRHLLASLRDRYSQRELAHHLGISPRTLRRWEVGETDPPPFLPDAIRQRLLPLASVGAREDAAFTFIDLFAGIGGIRAAFERQGGRCVFTSEWNKYACQTYLANFPESTGRLEGDIRTVDERDIPDHDVLLAGFPCQSFSIAGVSKKNALGRKHGFADEAQGTLFFDVARIIKAKQPVAFLLENVKNVQSHDHGNTFRVIRKVLEDDLHYRIHVKVIDARHFVPQHRERILIVGFREATDFTWDDLQLPPPTRRLGSILHPQDGTEPAEPPYTDGSKGRVNPKYTLTTHLWQYLQDYAAKHKAAGHGFGFGLVGGNDVARTLSARYYKDGSEILVKQGTRKCPRRLTPRECARLMGFPDTFKIPVSDTQAYQLFAHAAVVPMIEAVAKYVVSKLPRKEPTAPATGHIMSTAFPTRGNWTREQLKLAFYLYCQLSFGKLHHRNPQIIKLAKLIGRTPSALAMKLVNFASLDPAIRESGRSGLGNASALDREVWNEFHANWEGLVIECQQTLASLAEQQDQPFETRHAGSDDFVLADYTGDTRRAIVQQRVKQDFFRRAVLSSYHGRCCISGVSDARLLIASHIVPWAEDKANRLNPGNGLCLSAIHDKAFDSYLFSLTDDWRIVLSAQLRANNDRFVHEAFHRIDDQRIEMPERFHPDGALIARHRAVMLERERAQ